MAAPDRSSDAYKVIQEQWYPSGSGLDRDRQVNAQTVFQPKDIDKWLEKGINKSDLKGYDTTDAREPSVKEIASHLKRDLGVGYVESEPDRFLRTNHLTRQLLENDKAKITDYDTFKRVVVEAWNKDRSLQNLTARMIESDFKALYQLPEIQKWVEANSGEVVISGLMRRFNLERRRAEGVYQRLTPDNRMKILNSLSRGTPIRLRREPEPEPIPAPPQNLITQRSRRGTQYQRTRPAKWTELQIEFLRNNRPMPNKNLITLYNRTFSQPRTPKSIVSKKLRLS